MYKRFNSKWIKHADFILLDILALEFSYIAALLMRFGTITNSCGDIYPKIALLLGILNVCVAFFDETYSGILKRGYLKEAKSCFNHVTRILVILIACLYITKSSSMVSRLFFLYLSIFSLIITWTLRNIYKSHAKRVNTVRRRMIVLSNSRNIENTVSKLSDTQISITGLCIFDKDMTGSYIQGIPVVSSMDGLLDYIKDNVVDGLVINLNDDEILPDRFLDICLNMGVVTHECLAYTDFQDSRQLVERIGNYTVLTRSIYIASAPKLFIKRAFDIFAGLVGVIVTAVVALFIGPAIYIASPGPIFFSQTRVGRNGRKFKIFKFRSMYMDAEKRKAELLKQNKISDGMMFKIDNDPRIIKGIGHFIRNYSIDELPQLWNVLKGEMSLVGTRPPTVGEYEKYDYHHKGRLAIKPGITGMWQVSGRSNITDFEEVVKLDTQYITNWSLGLDLKILFKTISVVLKGDGAA